MKKIFILLSILLFFTNVHADKMTKDGFLSNNVSYLKDQKKQFPCAAYLNGEYGVKDLYVGVPVIIGKNGVEKVVEINLNSQEKSNLDKSIKAVQELFDAAQKIDPELQ